MSSAAATVSPLFPAGLRPTFINLEDETGTLNVTAGLGVWNRFRRVARESPTPIVRAILERSPEGVTNLIADRFEPLTVFATTGSRDFR